MTWKQIGAAIGVSSESARQIYLRAIAKLVRKNYGLDELAAAVARVRHTRSTAQTCIDLGDGTTGTAGGAR